MRFSNLADEHPENIDDAKKKNESPEQRLEPSYHPIYHESELLESLHPQQPHQ
eukprot:CAMPEP_0180417136 /NCGR_PEP_ID=MMETSP1036_2-20121128/865_1 /TAXON_ID=632150 /ORGANISM="Azadinium spinosum, Strain 3D9" /LENGTH=52 /DNA_ID=CAMNT_0022422131 /DNA_START=114 /DNA_END=269 /DNA_ORIENTATION=+